jgi:hypothetical protein
MLFQSTAQNTEGTDKENGEFRKCEKKLIDIFYILVLDAGIILNLVFSQKLSLKPPSS